MPKQISWLDLTWLGDNRTDCSYCWPSRAKLIRSTCGDWSIVSAVVRLSPSEIRHGSMIWDYDLKWGYNSNQGWTKILGEICLPLSQKKKKNWLLKILRFAILYIYNKSVKFHFKHTAILIFSTMVWQNWRMCNQLTM